MQWGRGRGYGYRMAKVTTTSTAVKAPVKEPPYLFLACRREGASKYRLAWGEMTSAGVVDVVDEEECGSLPVMFAAFKRQAMLYIRRKLERL